MAYMYSPIIKSYLLHKNVKLCRSVPISPVYLSLEPHGCLGGSVTSVMGDSGLWIPGTGRPPGDDNVTPRSLRPAISESDVAGHFHRTVYTASIRSRPHWPQIPFDVESSTFRDISPISLKPVQVIFMCVFP